jgi:hypothetical protein
MARADVRAKLNDWRISGLIDTAQQYSNPTGQIPSSAAGSLASDDGAEHERGRPPDWFQPTDHADDRDGPQEEPSNNVPGIAGDQPSSETSEPLAEGYEVPDPPATEQSIINALGPDALAYYAPFHFYVRTHWGIYIRDYGVAFLASEFLRRRRLTRADNWALRCAYWLLLEHEHFHFQTEVAATRYEVLTRDTKAYERLFQDADAGRLEESMANACAYRELANHEDGTLTFPRIEHFRGFASSWMKTQGKGYQDYDRWCRSANAMQRRRAALTAIIHKASTSFSRTVMDAV